MKSEEFKEHARFRNVVESLPSIIRRRYRADRIPAIRKIKTSCSSDFRLPETV